MQQFQPPGSHLNQRPGPIPVLLLGFESTVLNAIYALLPWKEKPGGVELKMARGDELGERYGYHLSKLVSDWTTSMCQGAAATGKLRPNELSWLTSPLFIVT
ncbi:MAG TPA: hypothetical protein PKJ41_09485 [Bryobacteraceae bacterium]|nr:hypothetical protein [Bryobacteraceae bacterium]HPT29181.1 hypothetical protein [Bryobacteraceae bacterium]